MDTRLLAHYEAELAYLRDMGAEFAEAYPKIASRLGMEGLEVLDPYVERLLEGTAFLAARVQLEIEQQFPELTSHLLEIVYPHYLAPVPSIMVVAFEPDINNAGVKSGFRLARHTLLRSRPLEGEQTACIYRTAAEVTLWPLRVAEAEYIGSRGELVAANVARDTAARAGIRLRLQRSDSGPMAELALDRLVLHLGSTAGNPFDLHETLCTRVLGLAGRSTDPRADWVEPLRAGAVVPRGFEPDEALLPVLRRSFDGYRLLQEYFAMPARFHFVELTGLLPAVRRAAGDAVDIYILLADPLADEGAGIRPDAFVLHAVPAVNLFERRFDRAPVSRADVEQHVVVNRTAPLDYEIHTLESVVGISGEGRPDVTFEPFYSATDLTSAGSTHPAYYTVRRRLRQRTERERLRGTRTSYLGAEIFLSLVDRAQAPYPSELSQLSVRGLVTNRDLPLLLSTAGKDTFHLPDGGPVLSVTIPVPPTRPRPGMGHGDTAWRLISHLSLNYLSIAETEGGNPAAALRELVGLYVPPGDRALAQQLEGIAGVSTRPIVRRMTDEVLSTAVRGLELRLEFDESFFEGTGVYALAAVLERFFRKYVAVNSFTETVLRTQQRGEITRWKPEGGLGRLI
jgi:type VI secretion system protein ImpG